MTSDRLQSRNFKKFSMRAANEALPAAKIFLIYNSLRKEILNLNLRKFKEISTAHSAR